MLQSCFPVNLVRIKSSTAASSVMVCGTVLFMVVGILSDSCNRIIQPDMNILVIVCPSHLDSAFYGFAVEKDFILSFRRT